MAVLASDSKEFKRAAIERTLDGTPVVKDPRGFYTQLGVAVVIPDPNEFRKQLVDGFRLAATKHGIALPRQFGSSEFVVDSLFSRRYMEARAFLHRVLEHVQDRIEHVDVSWLIVSPKEVPTVRLRAKGTGHEDVPVKQFLASQGNVHSMVSSWLFRKLYPGREVDVEVDHFQGKPSRAWTELSGQTGNLRIVPKGDECNPYICIADILAYLTDKGLHANRWKLFPDKVEILWSGRPFKVRAGYLDPGVFPDIAPTDNSPIDLHRWYPSPMTYLLVDSGLLSETTTRPPEVGQDASAESRVTYRDLVEASGFAHAPILSAQLANGGFKFFDAPTDAGCIKDGDHLVYMGSVSKTRSETIQTAVDVEIESLKDLRIRLRARGFSC